MRLTAPVAIVVFILHTAGSADDAWAKDCTLLDGGLSITADVYTATFYSNFCVGQGTCVSTCDNIIFQNPAPQTWAASITIAVPVPGSKPQGAMCDTSAECATGFCVTGVCCDDACAGGVCNLESVYTWGKCSVAEGNFLANGKFCRSRNQCASGYCAIDPGGGACPEEATGTCKCAAVTSTTPPSAGVATVSFTYNVEAKDVRGGAVRNVPYHVICNWQQPNGSGGYNYTSSVVNRLTDAGGQATLAMSFSPPDSTWSVTSCVAEEVRANDYEVNWRNPDLVTGLRNADGSYAGTASRSLYPDASGSINLGSLPLETSYAHVPNPTLSFGNSRNTYGQLVRMPSNLANLQYTKGASATLWIGADGIYDHPAVMYNGMDQTNANNYRRLWGMTPGALEMWAEGVDLWIVNYFEGHDSVREHIDEFAWTTLAIQNYTYTRADGTQDHPGKIDVVIALSESGAVSRAALAAWEDAYAGRPVPIWFTFGSMCGNDVCDNNETPSTCNVDCRGNAGGTVGNWKRCKGSQWNVCANSMANPFYFVRHPACIPTSCSGDATTWQLCDSRCPEPDHDGVHVRPDYPADGSYGDGDNLHTDGIHGADDWAGAKMSNMLGWGGTTATAGADGWVHSPNAFSDPPYVWTTSLTPGTPPGKRLIYNIGVVISEDAAQRGGVGFPRAMASFIQDLIRQGYKCNFKHWGLFFGLSFLVGHFMGPAIPMLGYLAIKILGVKSVDLYQLDQILNSGPTRDFLRSFCPGGGLSKCLTRYHDNFFNEINLFNGNGFPKLTRVVGFSQGDWIGNRCPYVGAWGHCDHVHDSGTEQNPSITPHPAGEVWGAVTITDPMATSMCSNTFYSFTTEVQDTEAGSTSSLIGNALTTLIDPAMAVVDIKFLPSYQGIRDSLDMNSSTSTTRFDDVTWQPRIYQHQELGLAPNTKPFVFGYIHEYTANSSDRDGFPTCAQIDYTLRNTDGTTIVAKPANVSAGKLCTCDADDNNPSVKGSCNTQSAHPGYCGDGACDSTFSETATTCPIDCRGTCGDGICNTTYVYPSLAETTASCAGDCNNATVSCFLGRVDANGSTLCINNTGKRSFAAGASATFTATGDATHAFTGWTGACAGAGSNPSCTLVMNGNVTFAANFVLACPEAGCTNITQAGWSFYSANFCTGLEYYRHIGTTYGPNPSSWDGLGIAGNSEATAGYTSYRKPGSLSCYTLSSSSSGMRRIYR